MPATSSAEAARLHTILEAEAGSIQQFVELLALEQTALANGETDGLPGFAAQKNTLAAHLNRLAEERSRLLAQKGFSPDKSGIEAWCARHAGAKNEIQLWSDILELATRARELNRLNGVLIKTRMQHNAKALEILLGESNALRLYGPDGQSTTQGTRRINDAV